MVSQKGTMFVVCKKHKEFCPSLGCASVVLAIGREIVDFFTMFSIEEIDVINLNQKKLEEARKKFQELIKNKEPSCELDMEEKWEDWVKGWDAVNGEMKMINKRVALVITMPEGKLTLFPEEIESNISYFTDSGVIELLKKLKSKEIGIKNLEEEQKKDTEKIIVSLQREVERIKYFKEILN